MPPSTMPDRQSSTARVPLGKTFLLGELPGYAGKYLEIPAGRQGVVLFADGDVRLLDAGRQRVVSAIERLRGRSLGIALGYVPNQPLTAWLHAAQLCSGDGELVDVSLLCRLTINDPAHFLTEMVLPQGEIYAESITLPEEQISPLLNGLIQRYAADDLVQGTLVGRLLPDLQTCLEPALSGLGMHLDQIMFLSCQLTRMRAEIAEKALAIQERLQDVELQKKMMQVENQVQFEDFLRQHGLVLPQGASMHWAAPAPIAPAAEAASRNPLEWFRHWSASQANTAHTPWRISSLWREKVAANQPAPGNTEILSRRKPDRWWLGRTIWIGFVIILSVAISALVRSIAKSAEWSGYIEVLGVVWIFALSAILESLKSLYETRERITARYAGEAGITLLDDLTGNNRQKVDNLVRDDCRREILHSKDTLNDLRSRLYRAGQEDLALYTRQMEGKIEKLAGQVQDARFGPAPYVGDLKISRRAWEDMLDRDEKLLIRAALLTEDAAQVQQYFSAGQVTLELLKKLEAQIDNFGHTFEARSRALQPSDGDRQAYRSI